LNSLSEDTLNKENPSKLDEGPNVEDTNLVWDQMSRTTNVIG